MKVIKGILLLSYNQLGLKSILITSYFVLKKRVHITIEAFIEEKLHCRLWLEDKKPITHYFEVAIFQLYKIFLSI